jgi:hypothetical protein
MATAESGKVIETVGSLKKFLETIPDSIPVIGDFDSYPVMATLWKRDKGESGPVRFLGIESK